MPVSSSNRKMTHFAWLILVVIVGRISYLVIILNGSAGNLFCQQDALEQFNAQINDTITVEQCKTNSFYFMLADCITCWILEIYWATAIRRWSRDEEGYERVAELTSNNMYSQ